jgi:hypothetical protein
MAHLAVLALCLAPGLAQASGRGLTPLGNPGALVEAEGALAHRVRDKGADAALAATADEAAELIAPARQAARPWLKAHDATAWFADRRTDTAWASCDGTAGITLGTWRGGWFATVWKRQKKLDFKWLLIDAAPLPTLPPAPDWITGKVADCPPRPAPANGQRPAGPPVLRALPAAMPAIAAPAGADSQDGRSDDGSMVWRSTVMPDGSRRLRVWVWQDGAYQAVLDRTTAAGS